MTEKANDSWKIEVQDEDTHLASSDEPIEQVTSQNSQPHSDSARKMIVLKDAPSPKQFTMVTPRKIKNPALTKPPISSVKKKKNSISKTIPNFLRNRRFNRDFFVELGKFLARKWNHRGRGRGRRHA